MLQKSANAFTGKTTRIQTALLPRNPVIALLLATVFGLSSGSYGEETDDAGAVRYPAPDSFTVGARVEQLYYFPCADCHAFMEPNDKVRELEVEEGHPAILEHGNGLIWCLSCHDSSDYDQLRNLLAETVDFDNGYQVCRGCHAQKYADWTHGAHGKRVANWRGERRLYSCAQCHNPHRPSIAPRAPKPPPPIRAGLEPMAPVEADDVRDSRQPEWEQTHAR